MQCEVCSVKCVVCSAYPLPPPHSSAQKGLGGLPGGLTEGDLKPQVRWPILMYLGKYSPCPLFLLPAPCSSNLFPLMLLNSSSPRLSDLLLCSCSSFSLLLFYAPPLLLYSSIHLLYFIPITIYSCTHSILCFLPRPCICCSLPDLAPPELPCASAGAGGGGLG